MGKPKQVRKRRSATPAPARETAPSTDPGEEITTVSLKRKTIPLIKALVLRHCQRSVDSGRLSKLNQYEVVHAILTDAVIREGLDPAHL